MNIYIPYTLSDTFIEFIPYGTQSMNIFTYGTATDPPSPLHDSSSESVTKTRNNPLNPVLSVSDDPDSDPSS